MGLILSRQRALWLAEHLVEAIGHEEQVDELRRHLDEPPNDLSGAPPGG